MPDEQNEKDFEMRFTDFGLTLDEGKELQTRLEPGEWAALLAVQQMLAATPLAAPDAGFSNRVLTRLAARERTRVQRHNAVGALAFGLGSLLLTAYLVWSSPLVRLTDASSWVAISNAIASLIPAAETVLIVARTLNDAIWEGNGVWSLLLLALFSFGLSVVWARIVMRPAPTNRPIRATEV